MTGTNTNIMIPEGVGPGDGDELDELLDTAEEVTGPVVTLDDEAENLTITRAVADARSIAQRAFTGLTGMPGVVVLAIIVGIAAWQFSDAHHLQLLYADARSHLTIARRLFDGPNPGVVQFGTVWLPLPHVALALTSWPLAWFHSGFAVMPINILCLVIEAIALFSLCHTVCGSRRIGWVAVAFFLFNPSILYMHTTALTEPVLMAACLGTCATLAKWAVSPKPYSGGEIAVFCGMPGAMAVLSRYDGWAFVAAASVIMFYVAYRRWGKLEGGLRYAFKCVRSFVTLPAIAAGWWLWFNFINYGDPLEFQRGQYSAQAQQDMLDKAGKLPDKGDALSSVLRFSVSMVRGSGWILVGLAIIGMAAWLWRTRLKLTAVMPWLLVGVPFGFYVFSLYTGQIVIRLDNTWDSSMFNLRYGAEMVPGLAVFAALGLAVFCGRGAPPTPQDVEDHTQTVSVSRMTPVKHEWRVLAGFIMIVLIIGQAGVLFSDWRNVPVIAEGLQQEKLAKGQWDCAHWMYKNAKTGSILIDDSVNPMLPEIGAGLNRVIAPFSGKAWPRALEHLNSVSWVFVNRNSSEDKVYKAVRGSNSFANNFVSRCHVDGVQVFQRQRDVADVGGDRVPRAT